MARIIVEIDDKKAAVLEDDVKNSISLPANRKYSAANPEGAVEIEDEESLRLV